MTRQKRSNPLFRSTEKEADTTLLYDQEPAPEPDQIQTAATEPEQQPDKTDQTKSKHTPTSVYLTDQQKAILNRMADETGTTRHAIIQYAIRKVIREWEAGIKPEGTTVTKVKLK